MSISQKIRTILYPIINLDLDPPTPEGEVRIQGDLVPSLSFLVAKATNGTVFLEGTPDGSLKVADTGSGNSLYTVEDGTCANAYAVGQTFEYSQARASWDFKLDTTDAEISFQDSNAAWGSDIWLPSGTISVDFSAYGVRLKNHTAADNTVFQVVSWY